MEIRYIIKRLSSTLISTEQIFIDNIQHNIHISIDLVGFSVEFCNCIPVKFAEKYYYSCSLKKWMQIKKPPKGWESEFWFVVKDMFDVINNKRKIKIDKNNIIDFLLDPDDRIRESAQYIYNNICETQNDDKDNSNDSDSLE